MTRRKLWPLAAIVLLGAPGRAAAEDEGCTDTWPKDLERPTISENFPLRGTSGHVSFLRIKVSHKAGEQVFPAGLHLAGDSPDAARLKLAEFQFPDPSSVVQPLVTRKVEGEGATTEVSIPLIVLPAQAGRKELTLPRLPIAVSRASGQVHTLCTAPHVISAEDALASTPSPEKHPDPEPRPQREVWTTLRDFIYVLLVAAPVALLLAWLLFRMRGKWKKAPKPPPAKAPWETALMALQALQERQLLEKSEYEEYLDVVSDTLREYLGARYGFDGLESTTRESLRQLTVLAPDFQDEQAVRTILQRADLVKFARRLPSLEECRDAYAETTRVVRSTSRATAPDPHVAAGSGRPNNPRSSKSPQPRTRKGAS